MKTKTSPQEKLMKFLSQIWAPCPVADKFLKTTAANWAEDGGSRLSTPLSSSERMQKQQGNRRSRQAGAQSE